MLLKRILMSFLLLTTAWSVQAETTKFYDLAFPNLEGNEVSLSEYEGKVVLLNFWATWCPPCVREMPSMQRLQDKFADQPFEIVAINAGESADAIEAFLLGLDNELTFTILLDEKSRSFQEFRIPGLPMSYLISKDGELLETIMGGREWDDEKQVTLVETALKS